MLELLEALSKPGDQNVQANQQMGVNLTNAVKREGVVIIQNQSIEVLSRAVPLITRALRLCDNLEPSPAPIEVEVKALPAPEPEDPIEAVCAHFYQRRTRWLDFQEALKSHYLRYVVEHEDTKKKAALLLGIGPTYLSKIVPRQN